MHRKLFREKQKIPATIRKELIPEIESLHDTFEIIDFDDLPPETHKNAQKIALNSNFTTFDALHIAIAKYLSEYSILDDTGNPVTTQCYIVTSDTSDFSQSRFDALGRFVDNLNPITPKDALELLANEV